MNFRNDINGLRAIAVLSVVVFHFFPDVLQGGFSGVDVFFVISGYLMTSIVINNLDAGSFSILSFYLARARRILPALVVLSIFLLIYGWFFLLPTDYKDLSKHVASSVAFVSNVVYWRESGYFAAGAHEKWLLHTWSLSVEWQFYIIYPVFLIILNKLFGSKNIFFVLAAITVSLFILSLYMSFNFANQAYYMFYTRAWQMLAGGLVFLIPAGVGNLKKLSTLGYLSIFTGFFIASQGTPWPGYISLFPVLGTCLVIYASRENQVINSSVVQWFGTNSYSIYLWHWPVVVQLSYLGFFGHVTYSIVGIVISFALGSLSYKYIEKNVKVKALFGNVVGSVSIVGFVTCMAVLCFTLDGVISVFRPISLSDKAVFLQVYKSKHENLAEAYWLKCNAYKSLIDAGHTDIDPSCIKPGQEGGVFLWGDSHAEALSFGIRAALSGTKPFYQVTSAGCKALFTDTSGLVGAVATACRNSNKLAVTQLQILKPEIVIIAQEHRHDETDWLSFYNEISSIGIKHLILVGPVPQWRPSLPAIYVRRHWYDEQDFINDTAFDASLVTVNSKVSNQIINTDIVYVDLLDGLCKSVDRKYFCRAKINDTLLVVDYGHLSEEGSIYVVDKILMPKILELIAN